MSRLKLFSSALLGALISNAAFAADDLAAQIEAIVPLVTSGNLQALGGPDTIEEIVVSLEGRWFTLDNTVRNWERDGEDAPAALSRSIAMLCADDWENIVTQTITGPDSFYLEQRAPDGRDQGSFELTAIPGESRRFTFEFEDHQVLAAYQLENAPAAQQEELLEAFRAITEAGQEIWVPSPDIQIVRDEDEIGVWGRCPSQ